MVHYRYRCTLILGVVHDKENHLLFATIRRLSKATADTLAAAASNRKAYVWKMAAVANTPRNASKSNINKHTISLAIFFL